MMVGIENWKILISLVRFLLFVKQQQTVNPLCNGWYGQLQGDKIDQQTKSN